jgi:ubiquinone/menaquinone biosynthesis C-methylase UbiE
MAPNLDAKIIASYCISDNKNPNVQVGQTEHRINLVLKWGVAEGDHVLELGCGQGDCTAVLATAVGEKGTVTAIDPAPPEYG